MKILSRIEGDSDKIGNLLEELGKTVSEQLNVISGKDYSEKKNDGEKVYSVSLAKLKEMEGRLKSGSPVSGVTNENAYGKDRRTIPRVAESSADKGGISAAAEQKVHAGV